MKTLFVILGAFFAAALIALKVTSRKDGTATQPSQDAQPQKKSSRDMVTIRPRADPAAPGLAARQTNGTLTTKETNGIPESNQLDLILYTNWDEKVYELRRVVTTNYSVRPTGIVSMVLTGVVPVGPAPPARVPTAEEAQAAREARREELREKGEYKEMFAKEDDWREKSKALRGGMTLLEVIAVMGLPSQVEKFVETSKESSEAVPVPTNELSSVTGMAIVYYSPDGKPALFWSNLGQVSSQLPFDRWVLWFDKQGKLMHE